MIGLVFSRLDIRGSSRAWLVALPLLLVLASCTVVRSSPVASPPCGDPVTFVDDVGNTVVVARLRAREPYSAVRLMDGLVRPRERVGSSSEDGR